MSDVRKQIMAEIIAFMRDASAKGEDPWKSAERNFPGIPSEIVADAWLTLNDEETEKWWQSVEKTIDGEIIKNALAAPKKDGGAE